jgi:serine/threonine protein kinase
MPVPQAHARDADAPAPRAARRVRGEARALDLTGRVLGTKYRLLRQLGQGGMATIYEAEHVEIGKRMAVKVLTGAGCEETARRFLQEARAASQLRHDHIIDVTDYGRDAVAGEPLAYMVMEHLEGEDLAATLEQDGPLRWTRVLAIAKQICLALIAAHDKGIVHCDIKPANCFRIFRGETADFIKVLDFGVASFACQRTGRCTPDPVPAAASDEPGSRRKSGPRLGTPGYMAAELLSGGSYDHRVDIYALGVLMYRLLTNKMPYPAPRLYTLGDLSSGGPSGASEGSGNLSVTPSAPFPMRRAIATLEISAEFEAVVLKALAQDPEQRHANARALLAALEAAEADALPASPLPRDPLTWGGPANQLQGAERRAAEESASMSQTEVSRPAIAAHSSNSQLRRTAPDDGPGGSSDSWQSLRRAQAAAYREGMAGRATPSFAGLLGRAALALVVTTAVMRVAWTLLF